MKKSSLSTQDRIALTTALLDKLNALPMGNIIVETPEGLIINGKELDTEQIINFKESCVSLKENFARQVIHEQIRYKATEMGIHKSQTIDELMFAKAIIWCLNEENIWLEKFK